MFKNIATATTRLSNSFYEIHETLAQAQNKPLPVNYTKYNNIALRHPLEIKLAQSLK